MMDNTGEAEFWSGPAGLSWIEHEVEQDGLLGGVADAVIDKAGLGSGDRVLDIGCGAGAMTMRAAEVVGSEGRVLATDIAPPFIERVARRAGSMAQVGTFLGDAQTAEWPETGFDVALSRFGVMFFSDPAAAFANIDRALRPEGRVVFAAWARTEDNPYWSIPRGLIADRLGPQPKPEPNAPGPMGLADADWAMTQMRAGGLGDVSVDTREVTLTHEGGAAGASHLMIRIGPAVRPLRENEFSADEIEAFRRDTEDAFRPYEVNGKARIPALIHLFTARRL
jgi:SAM-dependent methyltransferase